MDLSFNHSTWKHYVNLKFASVSPYRLLSVMMHRTHRTIAYLGDLLNYKISYYLSNTFEKEVQQ
jgi:hypothetical protein